jgi:hypothetical protein
MRDVGIDESSKGVVTPGVVCTAKGGNFRRKKVEQNEKKETVRLEVWRLASVT